MTAAVQSGLVCECGHPKRFHHDGFDACSHRDCQEFMAQGSREVVARGYVSAVRAAEDPDDDEEPEPGPVAVTHTNGLIDKGKRSRHARTRSLAEKIELHMATLRSRLAGEAEEERAHSEREKARAEAKAKIARLEKELAEARSALRSPKSRAVDAEPLHGGFRCTDCGKVVGTARGLAVHRGQLHKTEAVAS